MRFTRTARMAVATSIGLALPQFSLASEPRPGAIAVSTSIPISIPIPLAVPTDSASLHHPETYPELAERVLRLLAMGNQEAEALATGRRDTTRQGGKQAATSVEDRKKGARLKTVWVPRKLGTPAARTGGATRTRGENLVVSALVPRFDGDGITLQDQPTFYWHVSADTKHGVNFTLIDPHAIDPILDVNLDGPFAAGVHAVDLRNYAARLPLGKQYQWFVAVVPDPTRRSADIVARGTVLRRAPEARLKSALGGAARAERVQLLAEEGIWYDALRAAGDEARLRDPLLQQVGLASLDRALDRAN